MNWAIINGIWLLAPLFLIWGWVQYLRTPNRLSWRSLASVFGLSAPILSLVLSVLTRMLAYPALRPTTFDPEPVLGLGVVYLPLVGMLVGIAGRPRLILPIVWASVGTVVFWFAVSMP